MIDPALLQHIARLARLELSEDESARLLHDVGALLERFADLPEAELDEELEDVAPAAPTGEPAKDLARPWPDPQLSLLPLAAHTHEGFYVAPTGPKHPAPEAGEDAP